MVAYVHWKEGDAFAELFVRWPDHRILANHAVPTGSHIGQITANNCSALDDHFAVEDDILGAAEHRVAAYLVSGGL